MTPAPTGVNSLRGIGARIPAMRLRYEFDAAVHAVLWSAEAVVGGPWEILRMSRLEDAQARLDAALRRLESAVQTLEAASRVATDSRDRQISSLIAELTALRQERDALNVVADQAASRIDAVIDRLRTAGAA
jgi:hypothetical protein